jgi:mono/diheme cytochrome c family protein
MPMRGVRAFVIGTFAAGFALVLSSAVMDARQEKPATDKPAAAGKVDAAEIYKSKCMVCHAEDGNSVIPNASFADGVWRHGSTIKEVTNTITNGVPQTAMMPFKGQLSPAEIAAMARFVRKFDKKLK